MSDLRAVLSGDTTIKAVLSSDKNIKAQINSGLTVNQSVDGGDYIHFDVTSTGTNQTFINEDLAQYATVDKINLLRNGVFLEPTLFTKPSANSIRVSIQLLAGDTLDVLATGSAQTIAVAGGSNTQVQFNNENRLSGSNAFTFNTTTNTVSITNAIVNSANISTANVNVINSVTLNTTNANLGDVGNVKINGGLNGYVLQTDGFGNLNWTAAGGGGNGGGVPGGVNTQVQFNDAGVFGGDAGFNYDKLTNTLTVEKINGNIVLGAQPNITSLGTLSSLNVSGTITANNYSGNIPGANVTGVVANANFAQTAGISNTSSTVTNNAQPNITSVGTLTSLVVSGNVSANAYSGSGAGLTSIPGSNVTGTVNSANTAVYAGTVTTNAQPNITSVGVLSNLSVTGTVTANVVTANTFNGYLTGAANTAGTVTSQAQPNVTSLGTLLNLSVAGNTNSGIIRTDNLQYANGAAWTFPGTYGDSNVAAYLPSYSGNLSPSNVTLIRGSAKSLSEPTEIVATAPTSSTNIDVLTNTVWYFTAQSTQNIGLNFRGNIATTLNSMLNTGDSMTVGIVITNNTGVAYQVTSLAIDGTNQTVRWMNGSPVAVAGGLDCYVITIIKTGNNAYTVIGNKGSTT